MTRVLTSARIESIQAFQRDEIERLAKEPDFAAEVGRSEHFSRVADWLRPELGKRVLELGCGPGRYAAMLASLGFDVVAVDPASFDDTWNLIRKHHAVDIRSNVYAEDLPFEDASFDHIACLNALLYFKDPKRALGQIHRVLRPGGRLLVRTVSRTNLFRLFTGRNIDPAARNHYTMEELEDLLRSHRFDVHEVFSYGFYPPCCPIYWWYLVNGKISTSAQVLMSRLTPARYRSSVVAFASRATSD